MKKNFSLVELLVVIAIISVLMSFLIPVLGQSREKARFVQCASQHKQIAYANTMYQDDNNGSFPYLGVSAHRVSWDDLLSDYDGRSLTDTQKRQWYAEGSLYHCPNSDKENEQDTIKSRSYLINYGNSGQAQWVWQGLSGYNTNYDQVSGNWSAQVTQVTNASATIFILDAEKAERFSYTGYPQTGAITQGEIYDDFTWLDNHNSKPNILMVDGSVQILSWGQLVTAGNGIGSDARGGYFDIDK